MKRRIVMLRHAQSTGKQANQTDYDRSLSVEGEAAAKNLGTSMLAQSLKPDYLLSSSATRARQTAELTNRSLGISSPRVQFLTALYEASTEVWMDHIRQLPDEVTTPLLVGHNPVLSQLASILAGRLIDLAPAEFITCELDLTAWEEFPSKNVKGILRKN